MEKQGNLTFQNSLNSQNESSATFSSQEENIKEVFKLNLELKQAVLNAISENQEYKDIEVVLGRNKINNLGFIQNINILYKGESIISDSDYDIGGKLVLVINKKDQPVEIEVWNKNKVQRFINKNQAYVGDILLPVGLRDKGLGKEIYQKISDAMGIEIVKGDDIGIQATKMWAKVPNEKFVPQDDKKLAQIYTKYLETTFPNHEKNIFWHGSSSEKIEGEIRMNERDSGYFGNGFYVSNYSSYSSRWGRNLHPMIIPTGKYGEVKVKGDYKDIKYIGDTEKADIEAGGKNAWLLNEREYSKKFSEALKQTGNIGCKIEMDGFKDAEVVVFDSSLIHTLGSENDIGKFKEFVSNNQEVKS